MKICATVVGVTLVWAVLSDGQEEEKKKKKRKQKKKKRRHVRTRIRVSRFAGWRIGWEALKTGQAAVRSYVH